MSTTPVGPPSDLPSTDLPPADVVTVAVHGSAYRLGDLLPYLPVHWRLVRRDWLDARTGEPEMVLLFDASGAEVAQARRRDPAAATVVVLNPRGDQRDVVAVLRAGADACVRTDSAAIVAAHLQACRRRQLASPRWSAAILLDVA